MCLIPLGLSHFFPPYYIWLSFIEGEPPEDYTYSLKILAPSSSSFHPTLLLQEFLLTVIVTMASVPWPSRSQWSSEENLQNFPLRHLSTALYLCHILPSLLWLWANCPAPTWTNMFSSIPTPCSLACSKASLQEITSLHLNHQFSYSTGLSLPAFKHSAAPPILKC